MNKEIPIGNHAEFTLNQFKKWDLIRYSKKLEEHIKDIDNKWQKYIDDISKKVEDLYQNSELSYKARIELSKILSKKIK